MKLILQMIGQMNKRQQKNLSIATGRNQVIFKHTFISYLFFFISKKSPTESFLARGLVSSMHKKKNTTRVFNLEDIPEDSYKDISDSFINPQGSSRGRWLGRAWLNCDCQYV